MAQRKKPSLGWLRGGILGEGMARRQNPATGAMEQAKQARKKRKPKGNR